MTKLKAHKSASLIICFILLVIQPVWSQISPPGLDGANTASWMAVAVTQRFSERWSTTAYFGASAQGSPDNHSFLQKPAIFVLNQETSYHFNSKYQLALCTSLRYQELYEEMEPFSPQDPSWRKEIRYYLRLFRRLQTRSTAWVLSFRPELRTFYTLDGEPWSSPTQWRFRLKAQSTTPLNSSKSNSLVIGNELLWATKQDQDGNWSPLKFTEDRLSTYFRHTIHRPNAYLDLGFMHQFKEDNNRNIGYTIYFAADVIFLNPFGAGRQKHSQ